MSTQSAEIQFVTQLRHVLGPAQGTVALHEPEFSGSERELVLDCIDSTFVSSVGKYVDRFESMLAEYTGARHAIAVANGTVALQVALRLAGVDKEDEVVIPALSFVATANSVSHCGAVPHFVDSSLGTLGIDAAALEAHLRESCERVGGVLRNRATGRRLAAIVPMHALGHAVDIESLLELGERWRLPIVEDAAESLGTTYKGRHTGTFGQIGALSFNGNKIVTTGGGGAILTNDADVARRAKHLTTTAKRPHRWEFFHDEVAWNYRLPNLNAALGCAQLERLDDFVARKRKLASRYAAEFARSADVCFVAEPAHCRSNYWLNTVRLAQPDIALRDRLLGAANDAGYQCRPVWTLLHTLPMYTGCPRASLPVAEVLARSLISVPSSPKLASAFA